MEENQGVTSAATKYEQAAIAARAERDQSNLFAGLRDLAFSARSLRIPDSDLTLLTLPKLKDMQEEQLAEDAAHMSGRKVGQSPEPQVPSEPLASISFTAAQMNTLAKFVGMDQSMTTCAQRESPASDDVGLFLCYNIKPDHGLTATATATAARSCANAATDSEKCADTGKQSVALLDLGLSGRRKSAIRLIRA